MSGRRLVLLRHGRTAWNAAGRAQGHRDAELDEVGHAQAAAVAPHVAALEPVTLWSSDLSRARQTCAYVERATGLTARVDARLREYDVGAREGMDAAEFEAAFPAAYAAWREGDDLVHVPGAESAADVEARVVPALREVWEGLPSGRTAVVVTHGACLKVAVLALLGWPPAQAAGLQGLDNCGWVVLVEGPVPGSLRLEAYNRRA